MKWLQPCFYLPFLLFSLTMFAESWIVAPLLLVCGNLKSWIWPSVLNTYTSNTEWIKKSRKIWIPMVPVGVFLNKTRDNGSCINYIQVLTFFCQMEMKDFFIKPMRDNLIKTRHCAHIKEWIEKMVSKFSNAPRANKLCKAAFVPHHIIFKWEAENKQVYCLM